MTVAPPTASVEPSEQLTGFDLADKVAGGFPDLGDDVGPGEGVRIGRHEGYDRVVFDFTGSGTITYRVRYVDTPVADVVDMIEAVPSKLLKKVSVIGVYHNAERLGAGWKNVTLNMVYRDDKNTISQKAADSDHNRITTNTLEKLAKNDAVRV